MFDKLKNTNEHTIFTKDEKRPYIQSGKSPNSNSSAQLASGKILETAIINNSLDSFNRSVDDN